MLGYTPPWADTPQCMLGYTPPCPVHAGIHMATAADGTHPTGMHSCLNINVYVSIRKSQNEAAKVLATDLSNGPSYQGYVGAEDSLL